MTQGGHNELQELHMYHQQSQELPHDLILSIQRILDLKDLPETDPLDIVGDGFNAVDVINGYFPDGASRTENSSSSITKGLAMLFT